ncbi:xibalbin-1 isoform X2 [Osmia lignaria lignaria]|uniref:U8-agatoxin-Ao1a-like isoform X2 n=1 Tax=Osmia bicornis bicornis TaxID=1437191 RepID=UPI0010F6DDB0|nr:U8-agatoxin-Ao1a-like isoform X2 [Osmia bicornis bicornis]XP_034171133.1 U8-agatoxin-Ao1a-like isoform X2 [Osmia lignaria]
MKFCLLWLFVFLVVLADRTLGSPYIDDEEDSLQLADSDYTDNALENLMRAAQQKRACIRRGGNCDHRPKDCCYSSSCRCNLWGSNCQCQRMGLFQKWG